MSVIDQPATDPAPPPAPHPDDSGSPIGTALFAVGVLGMLGLIAGLIALAFVALVNDDGGGGGDAGSGTASSALDISLTEFAIDGELSAPAGDVTLNIVNAGAIEHNVAVRELGVQSNNLHVPRRRHAGARRTRARLLRAVLHHRRPRRVRHDRRARHRRGRLLRAGRPRRRARRAHARGDGPADGRLDARLPGRDRRHRQPDPRAGDPRRRHQEVRAHRRSDPVGGLPRRDSSRHGPTTARSPARRSRSTSATTCRSS